MSTHIVAKSFSSGGDVKKYARLLLDSLSKVSQRKFRPDTSDWSISAGCSVDDAVNELCKLSYGKSTQYVGWRWDPEIVSPVLMDSPNGAVPLLIYEPTKGLGARIVLLGKSLRNMQKSVTTLLPILDGPPVLTVRKPVARVVGLAFVAKRKTSLPSPLDDMLDTLGFVRNGDQWLSKKLGVIVEFPTVSTVAVLDAPF